MPEFTGTQDLRGYLTALWRWKLLFLLFLIGCPLVVYLVDRGKPKVYSATALVGVNNATVDSGGLGGGGSFTTSNLDAIAALVTTTPVASVAADLLHPPAKAAQIVGEVSASAETTTGFLRITAVDQHATRAAEIANAFARAIAINLQDATAVQIASSIRHIERQLRHLGHEPAVRAQLLQQLVQLRASSATQGSQAAILQAASPPSSPSGPHLRRTVEIALLIGLLLGLGSVLVAENLDRRLRMPVELEHMADVPLLATIPPTAFSGQLDTGPADEEAFQMLRTALLYFNPSRKHQSVLVTSAGEKDGKTTIAVRLALAAARSGLRVVLVDADLRRTQIGQRLGIDAREGLGAVLAEQRAVAELLVPYPVDEPGAGSLFVLPAGAPAANPAALISSPRMAGVLKELESAAHLVVIDTPAALMVSDPLPLMDLATGVILVARMNRSARDRVKRLRQIVSATGGNLLGVVATGTPAHPRYGYSASKYYSQNGHADGRRFWKKARSQETFGGEIEARASNEEVAESHVVPPLHP